MKIFAVTITFALAAAVSSGCTSKTIVGSKHEQLSRLADVSPRVFRNPEPPVQLSRYGVGCYSFAYPGEVGPPSYLVQDIGKPSVPNLGNEQRKSVDQIQRYIKSRTLRFVWVTGVPSPSGLFAIYDAVDGPCPASEKRYAVLNDDGSLMYQPSENPFELRAMPRFGNETPHPWNR